MEDYKQMTELRMKSSHYAKTLQLAALEKRALSVATAPGKTGKTVPQ